MNEWRHHWKLAPDLVYWCDSLHYPTPPSFTFKKSLAAEEIYWQTTTRKCISLNEVPEMQLLFLVSFCSASNSRLWENVLSALHSIRQLRTVTEGMTTILYKVGLRRVAGREPEEERREWRNLWTKDLLLFLKFTELLRWVKYNTQNWRQRCLPIRSISRRRRRTKLLEKQWAKFSQLVEGDCAAQLLNERKPTGFLDGGKSENLIKLKNEAWDIGNSGLSI